MFVFHSWNIYTIKQQFKTAADCHPYPPRKLYFFFAQNRRNVNAVYCLCGKWECVMQNVGRLDMAPL